MPIVKYPKSIREMGSLNVKISSIILKFSLLQKLQISKYCERFQFSLSKNINFYRAKAWKFINFLLEIFPVTNWFLF